MSYKIIIFWIILFLLGIGVGYIVDLIVYSDSEVISFYSKCGTSFITSCVITALYFINKK